MFEFFLAALAFGLSAGLQPGPLTVIILHQTLTHGLPAGLRACLAPLFSDGPIIGVTILALPHLNAMSGFASVLNLVGGIYLFWIARSMAASPMVGLAPSSASDSEIASPTQRVASDPSALQGSLGTAIRINLLNPNPYLFWFAVGGSQILRGTVVEAALFIATFLVTITTTKMAVALLAARCQTLLTDTGHRWVMRLLAGSLALFGLLAIGRGVTEW
ncbi:MAG: LysE family transporter [Magnetococcus sp. YQC-9]